VAGKALRLVSGKVMKKLTRETMEEAAEVDRKHLEGEQPPPPPHSSRWLRYAAPRLAR